MTPRWCGRCSRTCSPKRRGISVVGVARNGVEALAAVRDLRPDVVTLDIQMPEMDGLEALRHIVRESSARVVMLTSVDDPDTTYRALELGAIEFIGKPHEGLASAIERPGHGARARGAHRVRACRRASARPPLRRKRRARSSPAAEQGDPQRVVVIASSTGGPLALEQVFSGLRSDLPASYLVVQHLPAGFAVSFAARLAKIAGFPVVEAQDGMRVQGGLRVRRAVGDAHAHRGLAGSRHASSGSSTDPRCTASSRPPILCSRAPLRRSASVSSASCSPGMGSDGASGLAEIRTPAVPRSRRTRTRPWSGGCPGRRSGSAPRRSCPRSRGSPSRSAAPFVEGGRVVSDGFDMEAYREVFLSESAEYLQGIVDALLTLESDPEDLEPVEAVFRAAHSLKGMSATMGYQSTASLTHTMESLMDTVRKREQPVTGDLIDLVLRATDTLRDLINDESSGGAAIDPELMVQELRERTDVADAGGRSRSRDTRVRGD